MKVSKKIKLLIVDDTGLLNKMVNEKRAPILCHRYILILFLKALKINAKYY